jgi:tetratricopeptide (TPR) repeat protein
MTHVEKRLNAKGQLVCEMKEDVPFALGSGIRGRSYLIERDGFLFQSPISWYAGTNVWDLAPAYRSKNQHFTRPVPDECIYCHANRAEPVANSLNHFRTPIFQGYAIGCERCHGPGELHVQLRENDKNFAGLDDTIVVPDRLDPELREGVCQQCHLQAVVRIVKRNRYRENFRPGLPLNQFVSYFVLPASQTDSKRAVGQVEQMYASRCFQESGAKTAKLGCLSCHDPHYYPDAKEKINYYRQRCLTCHAEKDCGVELAVRRAKSPSDNCIECHMPSGASSNIAHTAITDHRILRQPGSERPLTPNPSPLANKYPIVAFDPGGPKSSDADSRRDLGMALIDFASKQPSAEWGRLAEPLLEEGLKRWPDDDAAWEAKGFALMLQGRDQDALDAFRTALNREPNREKSLFGAALMAGQTGRVNDAIEFWTRAIALNPWNWEYHDELAKLYADRQEWKQAAEQCQRALKLNMASWETRRLLVKCLLHLGERAKAGNELEILLGFEPPDPDALRRWFAEESK